MNTKKDIDMKILPTTSDDVRIEPNTTVDMSKNMAARNHGLLSHLHLDGKAFLDELNQTFNSFATRKTIATGFFNLAMVTTNFAQMKQLITRNNWTPLNITIMVFIGISLLLQFVVACFLIFLAKSGEFIDEDKRNQLIRSNNGTTFLVLVITIVNIFINVFFSV